MNSEKFKAYLQLSRPVNVSITFVSILVACWIAGGSASDWLCILLAALTGALVSSGANAINDSFDIDIDRVNRPNRPLPRGVLLQSDARRMWLIVSITAIGMNLLINSTALLISVFAVILLYYYSSRLKRTVLAGNLVIGLMTGMAFIYGGAVVGNMERAVVPAVFAFLVNLARELIKDIEDVEGDRKEDAVTLPVKYGVKPTLVLATASLLVLIGVTLAAAKYSLYHYAFVYVVLGADLLILISVVLMWMNYSSANMRRVSMILKISMVVGLLSIIVGSL
jgi:geranylgeranylglycerol-phosphate geranylgeranyltransferase